MAEDYKVESVCKKETVKADTVFNRAAYAGGSGCEKPQSGLHEEKKLKKILTVENIEYTFEKIDLYFSEKNYENMFTKKNNKNLLETIESKRYEHLKQEVYKKYSNYLDMKLGLFLKHLKESEDVFYVEFLNKYGELVYSKFEINNKNILKKKGLYIFYINNELKYIGRSKDKFEKRINNGYGNISPKNCYLDGQSTNCHINSLITKNKKSIQLFVLEINKSLS